MRTICSKRFLNAEFVSNQTLWLHFTVPASESVRTSNVSQAQDENRCDSNYAVAFYLGIDGGGSKTKCVVGDEFQVLASVVAGPSNITRVGEDCARASLHEAVRKACEAANIDPRQIRKSCIGVAGVGREDVANIVRTMVAEVIPGEINVVGDMEIALQATLGNDPGIVVIAGTGSIAYGRDARGRTARAGGWGFAISDEGSAHWIGREAVAAVLRAADQRPKLGDEDVGTVESTSPLVRELKAAWMTHSFAELAHKANSQPDFAALLPAVVEACNRKDELAQRILMRAGAELAQLAGAVTQQLFASHSGKIALGTVGGVFRHAAMVRESFCDDLGTLDERLEVNCDVMDPIDGALAMARKPSKASIEKREL
jgi:glucosamine kinase